MLSLPVLVAVIVSLILVNGLFAAMEIALVAVPRARLHRLAEEGKPGAATALAIRKNMDGFFAAVQIGVTFVATLSSVLGGAMAVDELAGVSRMIGLSPDSSLGQALPIFAVTVTISYISLVVGELVPKSIARRYPGRISLTLAPFFNIFSRVTRPAVRLLTASTMGVLKLLGIPAHKERAPLTTEEFILTASELLESNQIPKAVYDMLVRVTRLTNIHVEDVMIPRSRMVAIRVSDAADDDLEREALKVIESQPFTNYPVFDSKGENPLGVLNLKDFLRHGDPRDHIRRLRKPRYTVRTQPLSEALAAMQKDRCHLLFVVDEHGVVDGIITLDDILEELVGVMNWDAPPGLDTPHHHGLFYPTTVDAQMTLHELDEFYSVSLPTSPHYSTLAGFILDHLGRIPAPGDVMEYDRWRFEIVAMEGNRIDRVRIKPAKEEQPDEGDE